MADYYVKLIVELENQVKAQLAEIESAMMKIRESVNQINYSTEKARNSQIKFIDTAFRSGTALGEVHNALKTVGATGQNSFNQLTAAQKRTMLEFSQLSPEAMKVTQRIQEIGLEGKSSFQQLTQAEKKALTQMTELSQSVDPVISNFSRFNMTAQSAQIALRQMDLDPSLNANLQAAKVKVNSLGGDITSTKGKLQSFGIAAKTSITNGFNQAINSAKSSLSTLKGSISSAKSQMMSLNSGARTAGGGLSFLSSAASMTVGMVGYDLVNSMIIGARESINASASFERFGERLGMTGQEIAQFRSSVDEMQNTFRKVDMTAVGAAALEMGVKLKLPKESMEELTKTTAVMSSAFVKEGRTQTDAILAVSDALDGQFRRMQELGISQEMLMQNGWDGDINNKTSLLQAMNKTLDDMGFTQTASEIVTLDDAWAALTVTGSKLIQSILVPITPIIIGVVDAITNLVNYVQDNGWAQGALLIGGVTVALSLLAGAIAITEGGLIGLVVSAMPAFITSLWAAASGFMAITVAGAPLWAIVAAIAAIAFAVYELGIAFGWWEDVGSMIEAIKNNIGRLWDAFINHPDVKAVIQGIQDAWEGLNEFLKPVVDWLKGIWDEIFPPDATEKFDITRALIDAIGLAFEALKIVLTPVIVGFQLLYQALSILWNEVLTPIAEFLMSVFLPVWNLISNVLSIVWGYINQLLVVFQLFQNGQISLSQMLSLIWQIILSMFMNVLSTIISTVMSWASNLVSQAINAAQGFVNGIINWISQLPGRFYSFLMSVISYIVSAGGQWISNAKTKAKGVVDGVLNFIKQLPGKVYTEFMNIGKRILSAGSDLVNKAKQVGQNIVDGILGAMGIHSPGTIQESVVNEFVNMLTRVKEKGNTAYDTAKQVGRRLIDGFKSENVNEELSEAINFTPQIESEESEGISFTQDNGDKGSDETGGAYGLIGEDMTMATESIMASNNAIGNSFSTLTNTISLNTGIIQTRTNGVVLSFNSTRAGVTNALSSMVSKNNSSWNNISRTTDDNLQSIQSSTLNVTGQMTSAWNSMKDSIISAAADIQSKANAHFNSLSSNIGGFYRRIQNPSSWAGPSTSGSRTSSRGAVISGAGRLRNIVSSAITPTFAGTAPIYKLADSVCKNETCREFYLTKNNRLERFDIEEFYRRANNNFAGWGDWSPKHFSYIKSRTGEWNMKGPVINLVGGIPTGLAFKVKQFENGSKPSLGMESFQKVAEAIFSVIGYDYYWNSDKTGDPITALQTGSVNCWDGAHSLMALANVFGLSASLGRGTGHVWAVINGKTFDTTNYSKHRSWSPLPGYTGPRRRHSTQKEEDNVPEVIDLNINQNVDVHLKSDGNIEVDEATIVDTLKGVITDRTLVDKIAKALKQRDRRINRMSGA